MGCASPFDKYSLCHLFPNSLIPNEPTFSGNKAKTKPSHNYPIPHALASYLKFSLELLSNSTGKFIHNKLGLKKLFSCKVRLHYQR